MCSICGCELWRRNTRIFCVLWVMDDQFDLFLRRGAEVVPLSCRFSMKDFRRARKVIPAGTELPLNASILGAAAGLIRCQFLQRHDKSLWT